MKSEASQVKVRASFMGVEEDKKTTKLRTPDTIEPNCKLAVQDMSAHPETWEARQPLGEMNGTSLDFVYGKPNNSEIAILQDKTQHFFGSVQDGLTNNRQKWNQASSEGKLLKTEDKLPAVKKQIASLTFSERNKENLPPLPQKEDTSEMAKINEILAKCAGPSNKIVYKAQKMSVQEAVQEQPRQRLPGIWDEYCPAPTFDLGVDELIPAWVNDEAKNAKDSNITSNVETETVGTSHAHDVINLEDDDWALEYLILAEEAEQRATDLVADDIVGSLSPSTFLTPEKISCTQTVVGSDNKSFSSSSGEPVTNQYERRLIKPPPCMRSPFMDYNDKKEYYCKPKS